MCSTLKKAFMSNNESFLTFKRVILLLAFRSYCSQFPTRVPNSPAYPTLDNKRYLKRIIDETGSNILRKCCQNYVGNNGYDLLQN